MTGCCVGRAAAALAVCDERDGVREADAVAPEALRVDVPDGAACDVDACDVAARHVDARDVAARDADAPGGDALGVEPSVAVERRTELALAAVRCAAVDCAGVGAEADRAEVDCTVDTAAPAVGTAETGRAVVVGCAAGALPASAPLAGCAP